MKNFVIISLCLILWTCKQNNNSNDKTGLKSNSDTSCKKLFDFDVIEYYSIEIDESEIWKQYEQKKHNKGPNSFSEFLIGNKLNSIEDSSEIMKIVKSNFIKNTVSPTQVSKLKDIFCLRDPDELIQTACVPFFRDFLVFKRNNETIAVAKICFSCNQIYLSIKNKSEIFGLTESDYVNLHNALKN